MPATSPYGGLPFSNSAGSYVNFWPAESVSIPDEEEEEEEVLFLTSRERIYDACRRMGYGNESAHEVTRGLLRYLVIPERNPYARD